MVGEEISFRQEVLKTFRRENPHKIVWQPRLEHWYNVNQVRGTLPESYRGASLLDIYRDLPASVRYYYGEGKDISSPDTYIIFEYVDGAEVKEVREGENIYVYFYSPLGNLRGVKRLGEWGCSWHYLEHPVKTLEDLNILEYIVTHTHYRFNWEFYEVAKSTIGEWGEIQFYWERSPFQRLFLQYMGIENTVFLIQDHPDRLKEYLKKAEEAENELFEVLSSCPITILNFGENIDGRFDSPRLYHEYLLPYYKKRVDELHRAGKFCHLHMDGYLKPLLPYLREAGFDGIEGATPLPQGDIAVEELKEAMGEMILLDGIPMLLFLPEYTREELEEFTKKILKLFSPNLILGISDEISPLGDIEKVEFVSQVVEEWNGERR